MSQMCKKCVKWYSRLDLWLTFGLPSIHPGGNKTLWDVQRQPFHFFLHCLVMTTNTVPDVRRFEYLVCQLSPGMSVEEHLVHQLIHIQDLCSCSISRGTTGVIPETGDHEVIRNRSVWQCREQCTIQGSRKLVWDDVFDEKKVKNTSILDFELNRCVLNIC